MIRQAGGPILLVPEIAFWKHKELVKTPEKSYTAYDLDELFKDLNATV